MIAEMNGFKVISRASRKSCIVKSDNKWAVKYPKNKEVSANVKGSKLFFFKERDDAEIFVEINFGTHLLSNGIIVPCVAKNVVKVKWVSTLFDFTCGDCCNSFASFDKFWKQRSHSKSKRSAPKGTYLAESITCLE
jgi:hypothetical protein